MSGAILRLESGTARYFQTIYSSVHYLSQIFSNARCFSLYISLLVCLFSGLH